MVVRERITLGSRVTIHAGSVLGTDGFGYRWDGRQHVKIPQIGTVVIEDDVEIGSCVCIDRAKFGATKIGRGSKIDNLVQIGHNVQVGPHCIIGTPDAEIVDELDPKPGDFQIRKKHYSAFNSTRLDPVLRELDIKRLFMTGAWTEACVQHTVIDAFYLNYEINVLSDCVSSPYRDAHEYSLRYMQQYHRANIITSEAAIAQFRSGREPEKAVRPRDATPHMYEDLTSC